MEGSDWRSLPNIACDLSDDNNIPELEYPYVLKNGSIHGRYCCASFYTIEYLLSVGLFIFSFTILEFRKKKKIMLYLSFIPPSLYARLLLNLSLINT